MIAPRTHTPVYRYQLCAPAAITLPRRCVEIGPGRGDFLFYVARQQPEAHLIGIEIKPKRFAKLMQRRDDLPNVTLILGDAREVLPDLADETPLDAIYINFPDPWPKRRHTKNRLMQPDFVRTCVASLDTGGELWFTTDFAKYATDVAKQLRSFAELRPVFDGGIATEDPEAYPTLFSEKWRGEGRTIYYQRYIKI